MDRSLRLNLVLSAIDSVTAPLKKITQGSGKTVAALKAVSEQKKQLDAVQKNATGFIKTQTNLQQTSQRLIDAREKVRLMQEAMRKGEGGTDKFRTAFTKANLAVRDLSNKSRDQRLQLNAQRKSLNDAGFSTSKFAQSQKALTGRITTVSNQLRSQREQLEKTSRSAQRYARAQAGINKMHGAGMSVMGHGLGAAYLGRSLGQQAVNVIRPGIEFGEQMSELQAVSRLSKDDSRFAGLKEQARGLGATTAFTASEVGAGQTFLARAGFSPEAIRASMGDMLDLALANGTDLARTADISSNISSAFKIDPEVAGNMSRVADVLSATASRANVDLEMLGDTMKYLGQAEGLNVSLEQSAALAGLLGNIGIQGGQAGTTLRAMLNRLSSPMAAGKKAMAEIGLNVEDDNGNLRNITELLDDIFNKTEKLGNVKRADLLKKIFGSEAGSGMAELVSKMGTGAVGELLTELKNAKGENSRMARTREDNIGGDLKGLRSAWDDIGITISEINDGPLRELITSITSSLRDLSAWMKENPELVGKIAKWAGIALAVLTSLGVVLAVVGGSMMMIAGPLKMILWSVKVFSALKTAIMGVGIATSIGLGPLLLIIAAIAIAAFLIWKNWDWLKAKWDTWWAETKTAWEGGWRSFLPHVGKTLLAIGNIILDWSPIGLFYKAFAAVMGYFGIELPEKFSEFGMLMVDKLIDSFKNLPTLFGAILDWSPIGLLYKVFAAVMDYFGIEVPEKFSDFGMLMVNNLIDSFKDLPLLLAKAVPGLGLAISLYEKYREKKQADNSSEPNELGAALVTAPAIPRPTTPLMMRAAATITSSDHIEFNITAAPGMNEQAIAQQVQRLLEERDRKKAARSRAALHDRV